MSSLLINEEFLTNIKIITEKIMKVNKRFNNGVFSELYNKTIFKLILIDYYFINKFKKLFLDLDIDIIKILNLDKELLGRVNNNLDFNVRKYINSIFDENLEVKLNLESVIEHYLETRDILSRFLYVHLKESEFKVKRQIIFQIKNWLDSINTTCYDFFFNIKLSDQSKNIENHNYKVLFSQDMYKTFKNSLGQIKNSKKKILDITSYINYIPIALWFDGYEITVVSNIVHQLRHLHFSIEQFNDLVTGYDFNTNFGSKKLLEFNILFDNIITLERFGELEYNCYDGILCNFVLSHLINDSQNNKDQEIVTLFFEKLQKLSTGQSIFLIQEEAKCQDLIEQAINDCGYAVMLKVSTYEGFDRINWLLKKA